MIATPEALSLRMMLKRMSTSFTVSGAVGSSRISTLVWSSTALAISTICIIAGDSVNSMALGSISVPKSSNIFRASSTIFFLLTITPLPIRLPMNIFSTIGRSRTSVNSWYTAPIPSCRA